MNFGLTEEQELLVEAARGVLARTQSKASLRNAVNGQPLPDLWPTACEAGWPGLLIPEEFGGVGLGPLEAMLVAAELGRALTSLPLFGHFAATSLLISAGTDDDELLTQLASGEKRAAYIPVRPPSVSLDQWTSDPYENQLVRGASPALDGAGHISGSAHWVPDAPDADFYMVPASTAGKTAFALVPADSTGVAVEAVASYDPRPLGHVKFERADAVLTRPIDSQQLAYPWYLSQALLAGEALGASEACLEMAVSYAKERFTFGRPIGSYQAIKHRLVEALRRNENLRSLVYFAGHVAEAEPDEFPLAASAVRAGAIGAFDFSTQANISIHGGIGATFEHDAPLYYRRAQLSRRLLGGASDASERVGETLLSAASAT